MDVDISMDIHVKSVDMDMDMDMDVKIHIHGNPDHHSAFDRTGCSKFLQQVVQFSYFPIFK